MKMKKKCKMCGNFRNRGISVDAIIVKNSSVLLVKRDLEPYKNYWALPGGYVEFNESSERACRREVREETGLTARKIKLVNVYSDPDRHPNQAITIAYAVNASGTPKAGDDAGAVRWFQLKKLPKLAFDHGKILRDYKSLK